MEKTTVYLPEDIKRRLSVLARTRHRSEASLIREALSALVAEADTPRPRAGLWASGDPTLSERVDDALAGFGER
jgi:plasmid stability protein